MQVVKGDLQDPKSLEGAFKGAHGLFLVTNFWESQNEIEQATHAVAAAKAAGVQHIVWSTLPNVEKISGGKIDVPHFTNKALVDDVIAKAKFAHFTFVEPPMYFQNLMGAMAPQLGEDGVRTFAVPMDPAKKVMHSGDISEMGESMRLMSVCSWYLQCMRGSWHETQSMLMPCTSSNTDD